MDQDSIFGKSRPPQNVDSFLEYFWFAESTEWGAMQILCQTPYMGGIFMIPTANGGSESICDIKDNRVIPMIL
jgi:hypothetical protein